MAYASLVKLIENQPPIGGTYCPPPNSLLAAFNVLKNNFFDGNAEIIIEGNNGEIPNVEGMIY